MSAIVPCCSVFNANQYKKTIKDELDRFAREDLIRIHTDMATIRAQDFNLSAGRYRPMSQVAAEHRDPLELLEELRAIEGEILAEVDGLMDALREEMPT